MNREGMEVLFQQLRNHLDEEMEQRNKLLLTIVSQYEENAYLAKQLNDSQETNERCLKLNNQLQMKLSEMTARESFKMALLESLASAVHVWWSSIEQGAPLSNEQSEVFVALRHFDQWQEEATRAMLFDKVPEPEHATIPSFAYVHTQTVKENKHLKAVAEAARKYADEPNNGESNFIDLKARLADLDAWQADQDPALGYIGTEMEGPAEDDEPTEDEISCLNRVAVAASDYFKGIRVDAAIDPKTARVINALDDLDKAINQDSELNGPSEDDYPF